MQSQIVCSGCRSILVYPRGASNVCCAICSTVSAVASPVAGMEMAQLVCGSCRTLLMYTPGASSVRCALCNTYNGTRSGLNTANQVAHVNCGRCHTTLMYPYGAPSVKCAVCQYVTHVGTNNMRVPLPAPQRPFEVPFSSSAPASLSQSTTVVVQNPMTMDETGKLVNNVVVGVTTGKK